MSALLSNHISTKTFNRFGHKVLIRNETSQTQFTKFNLVQIKELISNGLVLEMPANVCQRGHNLTLFFLSPQTIELKTKLLPHGPYKDSIFEVVAKVEKVEDISHDEKMVSATLTFVQYDVREWKKMIEECEATQEKINDLIMGQHALRESDE